MSSEHPERPQETKTGTGRHDIFTPDVSRAIRMARVLCITSMMTVHIWPGRTAITTADVPLALHWFYVLLIREFGLASVPLLSTVSGLLFYRSARSDKMSVLIASKLRTLLVPMVLWSALMLLMFVAKAMATQDREFFSVSLMEWINRVFAITAPPINHPLAFLRDIFLCCLIGLAATRLERLLPWAGRVTILALASVEVYADGMLLLRPQVLLFFCLGLCIAIMPPRSLVLPWGLVAAVVATDIAVQYSPFTVPPRWEDPANLLHRFAVALLMWRIAMSIAQRHGRLGTLLHRCEPLIFLVFCSHMLTISAMAVLFKGLGVQVTHAIYPLLFALQIPVIFAVASLLNTLGEAVAPRVLSVLTARR